MAADASRSLRSLFFNTRIWPEVAAPTQTQSLEPLGPSPAEQDLCHLAAMIAAEQDKLTSNVEAARVVLTQWAAVPTGDPVRDASLAALAAQLEAASASKKAALEEEAVAVDIALESLQAELCTARDRAASVDNAEGADAGDVAAVDHLRLVERLFERLRSLPCAPLEPSTVYVLPAAPPAQQPWMGARVIAPRGLAAANLLLLRPPGPRIKPGAALQLVCSIAEGTSPVSSEELPALETLLALHLSLEVEVTPGPALEAAACTGGATATAHRPRGPSRAAPPQAGRPTVPAHRPASSAAQPPCTPGSLPPSACVGSLVAAAPRPRLPRVDAGSVTGSSRGPAGSRLRAVAPPRPPGASTTKVGPRPTTASAAPPCIGSEALHAAPGPIVAAHAGLQAIQIRLPVQSVSAVPSERSSGAPESSPSPSYHVSVNLPPRVSVGDAIKVVALRFGGAALSSMSLPASVVVVESTGLAAPLRIDSDRRWQGISCPCVSAEGVLYAPPLSEATVIHPYERVSSRDMCSVFAPDGAPLRAMRWAALGVLDAGDGPLVSAYDDMSRTLFCIDGSYRSTRLLAIDPAGPSLRWSTTPGRITDCYGVAVCRPRGLVLAASYRDDKIQLYRIRDGCRVMLATEPPRMPYPTAVANDATSDRIVVAHAAAGRHSLTSLRWCASGPGAGFGLAVDGAFAGWPDEATFHAGAGIAIAVVPSQSPSTASHLVVGRGHALWVHALPSLAIVQAYTIAEGSYIIAGLASDPRGYSLVVTLQLPRGRLPDGATRGASLRVLEWPLTGSNGVFERRPLGG